MSQQPAQSQKLWIPGPVGMLEAILETPAAATAHGAVLVCHPHPQHGGTMQNKVVHTLARAFVRMGFAALRFNFRGTEGSAGVYDDGIGELDDALAALAWLRAEFTAGPIWLAGFSFGAAIAVRAATRQPADGLISVAPAVARFAANLEGQPECPWLLVQGDQDELVDIEETIAWLNQLLPGPELAVMAGADHFFHGRLVELRELVTKFVQKEMGTVTALPGPAGPG
jgi:alpha/beta superfamily hydrolase